MVNSVTLIGRLTRDPELKYTASGTPVARFSLAVDRRTRNANGEKQTDFIRISVWDKAAENAAQYLAKGRLVAIEGSLRINVITQEDGSRKEYAEVTAYNVTYLESAKTKQTENEAPKTTTRKPPPPGFDDDDVPF